MNNAGKISSAMNRFGEKPRNRSVRQERTVPELQQGLNLNFDSTWAGLLLPGTCPPDINTLPNGLRIDQERCQNHVHLEVLKIFEILNLNHAEIKFFK